MMSFGATPAPPRVLPESKEEIHQAPLYHVILLDDDFHTYGYVVEMLMTLFGHSRQTAARMTMEVDTVGRVVVDTVHKELAELRQEQIHEYGPDPQIKECVGSMRCVIEPAE